MNCPQCQSEVEPSAEGCFNCGHSFLPHRVLSRGSVLGDRYEILAPPVRGGMGMVYKALDRTLEETVAIKVLRSEVAAEPDMARRFRSEIRLARKVRHRNVCGIHEYGEQGALRYIAMEYIEGVDLHRIVRKTGPLPPQEAFETCIHVAEGLRAIHEAGIIHRDLKTSNLMRDAHGVVRLMDFGIAKQASSDATLGATAKGIIMGTPEYMSPEQARGERVDFRSDIYSMGIVIYELFEGRVPFSGTTPLATMFMQLHEPPPLAEPAAAKLPRPLVPVLARALAKSADDRFQSAAELVQALVDARGAAGILPPSPHAAPPVPPSSQSPTLLPTSPTSPTLARVRDPAQERVGPASATTPPQRRPRAAARPAPAPRTPTTLLWPALAVALLAAMGVTAWRAMTYRPLPGSSPSAGSPPAQVALAGPAAGSGALGTLIIDALPWGEVTEVRDGDGTRQDLGPDPYTPLAVALRPGAYVVTVRNPGFPRTLQLEVTVRASHVERELAEFGRLDASQYLRKKGL